MKDNVPSPYVMDTMIGERPPKKPKYDHPNNAPCIASSAKPTSTSEKEKDTVMSPFISDFPILGMTLLSYCYLSSPPSSSLCSVPFLP